MISKYSITLESYISPENSQNQQDIIDNYAPISHNPQKILSNYANSQLQSHNHQANSILQQSTIKRHQVNTVWPSNRNINDGNRRTYKCLSNHQLKMLQEQFRRGIIDKSFLCEKYGVSQTSILRFLRYYRQHGHLPQRSKRELLGHQDEYTQDQHQYQIQSFEQGMPKPRKFTSRDQNNRVSHQAKDNPYQESYD